MYRCSASMLNSFIDDCLAATLFNMCVNVRVDHANPRSRPCAIELPLPTLTARRWAEMSDGRERVKNVFELTRGWGRVG